MNMVFSIWAILEEKQNKVKAQFVVHIKDSPTILTHNILKPT